MFHFKLNILEDVEKSKSDNTLCATGNFEAEGNLGDIASAIVDFMKQQPELADCIMMASDDYKMYMKLKNNKPAMSDEVVGKQLEEAKTTTDSIINQ